VRLISLVTKPNRNPNRPNPLSPGKSQAVSPWIFFGWPNRWWRARNAEQTGKAHRLDIQMPKGVRSESVPPSTPSLYVVSKNLRGNAGPQHPPLDLLKNRVSGPCL